EELRFSDDARPRPKQGPVIGDQSIEPRRSKFMRRGKKPFQKRTGRRDADRQSESRPQKDFRPSAGGKESGKRFAKSGGKRFGRRGGKRFDKPGGKKFGKPGGKQFGKAFGKRKGRR